MEENNEIKIAHVINLPTLNVKSQININTDSNTRIKEVLNIETYLLDTQIEPMNNKALVKGAVGVKVIYVDVDNIYNTLSDSLNFSETINDSNITPNSQITISNNQFLAYFDNDDKSLHINIEGVIDCICNINSNFNTFNQSAENLVTKNSTLQAYSCLTKINKSTSFDADFKIGVKINKILSCNSKIILEECKCNDGYMILNGKIFNDLIYETDNNGICNINILSNSLDFKRELEVDECDSDCVADISTYVNLNSTQITTDISDNDTQLNIEYCINVNGFIYKTVNMNIVEDLYSLDNEIEIEKTEYELYKKLPYFKANENIDAEITLTDELNIDELLGMVNTSCNITKYTIKDNLIIIEGIVNGNLLYFNENHEIKHLPTQLPYSISVKQELKDDVCAINLCANTINCKCKIKRGNTLMIDYELCITGTPYNKSNHLLINDVRYGKIINYNDIAFQIYIAHPNESCWDLCKRLHVTQEKLLAYNKENPTTYLGGEKIIVYR